jgi:hypothetical protein
MTTQLRQTLRDSAAARWTALIIVSLTMMMGYFFTDVMGPLEAPLTTNGTLVYFDNGTYLTADSLMKVSTGIANEAKIIAGNSYVTESINQNGETVTNGSLATGMKIVKGETEYEMVVSGDTDGDGSVSSTDYMQIKKFFMGMYSLDGAYSEAADMDADNGITATDYLTIKKMFMNVK